MGTEWNADKGPLPIEVPSGNTAMIRRKTLSTFLKTGHVPNALVAIVRASMGSGEAPKNFSEGISEWSNEEVADLFSFVDQVVVSCVVQPEVWPVPMCERCGGDGKYTIDNADGTKKHFNPCDVCRGTGEAEREEEKLYVDDVDQTDKMFIFTYVTSGVKDLEPFREEQGGDVAPVPSGKGVRKAAKRGSSN